MGIGHIMRSLALAEGLRERSVDVQFVCGDLPGNMVDFLRQRSSDVALLPRFWSPDEAASDADYGEGLGATQSQDAEQTSGALRGAHLDWLIVDHYALDAEWESRLRSYANGVLVIDDLANRRHDCDLLVDQNFSTSMQDRYRGLIPLDCRSLIGPTFAILRPEYRQKRNDATHGTVEVRRIFIFFGGSDPKNLTGMAIDALCDPQFADLQVDVVIGVNNPHWQALEKAASRRPHTQLYGPRLHLADLMAKADLSIGAGGATTWERMCIGLPSVTVSVAENQRPACQALAEAGLIAYVGHHTAVRAADLVSTLQRVLGRQDELADISLRSRLMVDGWGAQRIVEMMQPTSRSSLRLRPTIPDDLFHYFSWANDSDVRAQSIQMEQIPFESHQKWFTGKLGSPDSRLFVMEAGDLPVGQIRFDREGNEQRIGYSIDKLFRGRGWAARLVELGIARLAAAKGVVFRAEVKEPNPASRRVFSRLGFSELSSEHASGLKIFRFDPSRQTLNIDPKLE